ncbi:MAG: response regulator transcription factor [Rhodanobacteraceae bacterium]|nr:response regulator transcription factor [Rhodanobacteraceae bacterium]
MSDKPIRIAIADDHPVVRRGLRAFLESQREFDVVIESGDGNALINALASNDVDVILLDLLMPGGGAALVATLGDVIADARILVLTSSDDAHLLFDVFQAGATSALLKDSSPEQLRDAILATDRGERVLHPRIASLIAGQRAQTPCAPPSVPANTTCCA